MSEVSGKVAHDSANDSHIYPVKVGGVYRATPPSVTDGDVVDLLTDEAGRLQIDITSGAMSAGGDVANDAVDSGNPVKTGGYAQGTGSLPTIVSANGDRVNRLLDRYGRSRNIVEYTDGTAITGDATYGVDVDVLRAAPKLAASGTIAGTGDIIASVDASNYQGWCLQLSGLSSSTVQVQGSNDNSTWVAIPGIVGTATSQSGLTSSLTGNSFYAGPVPTKYLKVACTAYGSGTISASLALAPSPPVMPGAIVGVSGAANQGATATGAPVRIGGVYQSSPSTLSDGQIGTPLLDTLGRQSIAGADAHDAAVNSRPVRIAGRARGDTEYTAVSQDDVADLTTTLQGVLRVCHDADERTRGTSVKLTAAEAGGSTPVAIKASRGNIYGVYGYSANAAVSYLQLFNVASGSVTVGTTPPTRVIPIPAASSFNFGYSSPFWFDTAMSYALTTTPTGSTAPVSACLINIEYK